MEIINTNKRLCEPYGEAVDNAFVLFQENARGLDTFGEQENDDIRERPEEISNNNDEEEEDEELDINNNVRGAPSHRILPIISDDNLNAKIRSLNEKQRQIFNYVLSWTRKTIQSFQSINTSKPKPFHIFLTGSAGCGKSYLLTTLKFYLQKALSYGSKNAEKERLLVLAPTGVAAVNVDGSTIHSTRGIRPDCSNGKTVARLSDKKRSAMRNRFS